MRSRVVPSSNASTDGRSSSTPTSSSEQSGPGHYEKELTLCRQRRRRKKLGNHRELLQTAKLNNVDPVAWLTQTLERIANAGRAAKSTHSCRGTTPPDGLKLFAYDRNSRNQGKSYCIARDSRRRSCWVNIAIILQYLCGKGRSA